ncbi:MAG: hypothetical protein AAFU79_11285 [Myxococcota bacterium]
MSTELRDGVLHVEGKIPVDQVEGLLETLEGCEPGLRVDLSKCLHLHTAGVQALRSCGAKVIAWPEPSDWSQWLEAALEP